MSIRPDGTHTEIAVSAIIYPEHGYIEGCIIDMTEKKQAAREKEQHFEHLTLSLPPKKRREAPVWGLRLPMALLKTTMALLRL